MMKRRVFRFIDLFSGAGGLARGFVQASDGSCEFRPVFAVEEDIAAAASYAANFRHKVFAGPIEALDIKRLPKADLVIGGPPCQGFSPLGKFYPTKHHARLNKLWSYFFDVVEYVQPRAFVIENVPEFLNSAEFLEVQERATALNYSIDWGTRNASDFGVPQHRRRGFCVGIRGRTAKLANPLIGQTVKSVSDAIGDLRKKEPHARFDIGASLEHQQIRRFIEKYLILPGDERFCADQLPVHFVNEIHLSRNPTAVSVERYRRIPAGGNRFDLVDFPELMPECWKKKKTGSSDVMGRLNWHKPSVTIRTEFFKPEKGRYLHPTAHRPITHLEAARLQTFPDDFILCGSKIQIAKQIGNAVPPTMAAAIAEELKKTLLLKHRESEISSKRTSIQLDMYGETRRGANGRV